MRPLADESIRHLAPPSKVPSIFRRFFLFSATSRQNFVPGGLRHTLPAVIPAKAGKRVGELAPYFFEVLSLGGVARNTAAWL